MKFFNKVQQDANRLFNKAIGQNGIFNKVNEFARKADNSIQRVGSFIRPLAAQVGFDGVVKGGLDRIHNMRMQGTDAVNTIKNSLEKAVKAPMGQIMSTNYA